MIRLQLLNDSFSSPLLKLPVISSMKWSCPPSHTGKPSTQIRDERNRKLRSTQGTSEDAFISAVWLSLCRNISLWSVRLPTINHEKRATNTTDVGIRCEDDRQIPKVSAWWAVKTSFKEVQLILRCNESHYRHYHYRKRLLFLHFLCDDL